MAQQFFKVGPQSRMDVDVPWRDETLEAIDAVAADLELRMLMGARLHALAARLRSAPSRPRPKMERVTLAQIRPVEFPGASPGWYLDQLSGREVVFEDQVNRGWWRETPYPQDAFTLGELVFLESELWAAAERIADARENMTTAQRELAVDLVEAADGLQMRLALMQWQPDSPEEEEAMKRSMLEALSRGDEEDPEDNPDGSGCEVLASHEYVSPRQRPLTAEEHGVREVAWALKRRRRWALNEAALEMAMLATPDDVLVPVPDSGGSTKANRSLARRISKLSGAPMCDALTRRLTVPSSRGLRAAGMPPLTVAAHEMLRMHGCPRGRVLFVDNVATTGGTGAAAASALGVPCALLVWAWHRTHAELEPEVNPKVLYIQPNKSAVKAAKRGLEARRKAPKSKKGGLDAMQAKEAGVGSGVLRARDIAAGKRVNAYQVKAFFDRHQGNYLKAKDKRLKPEESRAIQAWLIWGGDSLYRQAKSAVEKDRQGNPKDHAKGCDPGLVVAGPTSAKRAMAHPAVIKQHERSLRRRRKHKVAVLVPCASAKPYRDSPSHRLTYCPALEGKKVDVWVVSEPMGVFPYEWSDEFPNDAYEFAPKHVKGEVREQLVERIRAWMEKQAPKYDRVYLALPKHHMDLVRAASTGVGGLNLISASIAACKESGKCPANFDQVTTHAYRDYLRRKIR